MITPIEIRRQVFRKSLRGYDPDEVRGFLNSLSEEWEQQQSAYRALKEAHDRMEANYNSLKEVEQMLHKTLLQAEQSSKNTMENARQKAELKLREADGKARELVRRGIDERNRVEGEIAELNDRREEILLQLTLFLKSQLDRLKSFERKDLPAALLTEKPMRDSAKEALDNLFGAKNTEDDDPNGHVGGSFFDDIVNEL